MNAGVHSDFSYVKGINNITRSARSTARRSCARAIPLGIVESTYNAPCIDASTGVSLPGYSSPADCIAPNLAVNPNYTSVLSLYDLTRGGSDYWWLGRTDVKELALYAEDQIKLKNWNFNVGLREDVYNGLTKANQIEPRVGVAYNVKPSKSVLSISYARTLETPFNENLVLSSNGCANAVLSPLLACNQGASGTLDPGYRNEFHVSLQQQLGKNVVFSGEYIWKYTHNAFDFQRAGQHAHHLSHRLA